MGDKARAGNWSESQVTALVTAIGESKELLFAKLSQTVTADRKRKAWDDVTERVNSQSEVARTSKEIKKKWTTYQSEVKMKESKRKANLSKTGGGEKPQDLTILEKMVIELIPKASVEGIQDALETGISDEGTESEGKCDEDTSQKTVKDENVMDDNKSDVNGQPANIKFKRQKEFADEGYYNRILAIEEKKLEIKQRKLVIIQEQLDVEKKKLAVATVISQDLNAITQIMKDKTVETLLNDSLF